MSLGEEPCFLLCLTPFVLIPLPPQESLLWCMEQQVPTTVSRMASCLGNILPTQEHTLEQRGLENDPAGEAELHTLLSAPTSSPGITRSLQKEMSAGRQGMLLDAALTSLGHMGLQMLPVPQQPRAGGLLEPPLAAGTAGLTTPHLQLRSVVSGTCGC